MEKQAQVKFAKAINQAADAAYLETFVKRASENGIQINSEDDLSNLLKMASALRTVSNAVAPAIKEANTEFLSTALDQLMAVEIGD